jgi:GNAT superfamily N-acetyltransferase
MMIEDVQAEEAGGMCGALSDIYRRAWSETGFFLGNEELQSFSDRLQRHSSNPDFRLCLTRERGSAVGFAYGYTSVPGGWWRQMVAAGLPTDAADEWFDDCFEFAELAVAPRYQGRGIGAALHDRLLSGLPHRNAILSTQKENHKALSFYLRRGWRVMHDEFFFPNRLYPYVIMGLDISGGRGT